MIYVHHVEKIHFVVCKKGPCGHRLGVRAESLALYRHGCVPKEGSVLEAFKDMHMVVFFLSAMFCSFKTTPRCLRLFTSKQHAVLERKQSAC